MKAIIENGKTNYGIQNCSILTSGIGIDIKTPYTLIAQLRFLPRVVNSRLFHVPWSVKIVVHFYLNSARESSEHYVTLRITPIK